MNSFMSDPVLKNDHGAFELYDKRSIKDLGHLFGQTPENDEKFSAGLINFIMKKDIR